MNKKYVGLFLGIMLCVFSIVSPLEGQAKSMSKQAYNLVKNQWWTGVSSSGDDVRFTKTKVKYYDRFLKKLIHMEKIRGCKKYKKGYLILLGKGKNKYSYFVSSKKSATTISYYFGWKKDMDNYAGSSSLKKGRWE